MEINISYKLKQSVVVNGYNFVEKEKCYKKG